MAPESEKRIVRERAELELSEPTLRVVALVSDLMFASKIKAAAERRGVGAVIVRNADVLLSRAAAGTIKLALIDLGAGEGIADAIRQIRSSFPEMDVLAFGSHVDEEGLKAAANAGAGRVWPRSKFSASLDALMSEYA